jgi:hypothetical protein
MDIENDTKDLSRTLDDMQEKTRALNDSLQNLAREGFAALEKAASPKASSRSNDLSAGDIVKGELTTFLKQALQDGFKSIFGGQAGQGGGTSVIINNNASATVTAQETTGAFDRKYLEITIDQMVADSLIRGRQTSSVMRSLFGIAPSLLGR